MADTSKVNLSKNTTNDLGTLTSASAKNGETVEFDGDNEKMLFICLNGDPNDVGVKFLAGDRWQSSIGAYESDVIANGDYAAFVLETARFKNADGELKFELTDGAGGSWTSGTAADFSYDLLELP